MNKDDGVSWHIKTDESDESGMIIQISVNGEMSRFVKFIGLEILCSSPSQEKLNLNSSFGLGPKVEKYLFSDAKASDGRLLPEYLIVNRSNSGSKGMPTDAEWNKAGVVNLMERNELVLDGVPVCPNLVLLFLQRNSRLRHVPASFFDRMSVLSFLDLSNTRIKELPSSLFTLENLQVLLLRSCVCLKSLHADIKNLKKLEVLDALGTNLHKFPKEIEELSQLRHLHLSFHFPDYGSGYAGVPSELIPPGATFQLQGLQALSIAVHPEDERWKKIVSDIIKHVVKLEKLSYLQFYFPSVEDLKSFIEESPSWKEHKLKRFKFIVGHDIKRIVSRVPDEVESEYDQHNRCLRFVHGSEVPQVMKRILTPITAFYLDHHSEIQSLSEFGISNFKELRFCVVRECPNIQFVIFEESQSAAFPNLEYLGLHYLWELERIWEGPVPSGSFEALKYLMVATCPKLEYIASCSTLQSLSKLETLIIEDCESLKSVVEENEMVKYDDASFLPRLTKLVLRHLPQLVALGSGPLFLSEEMHIDTHCCPKLILIYNVNTFVGAPGVETSQVHKSEISHEDPSSSEGRREKMPIGGGDSYDVSEHSNEVVFQPELSAPKSEISHEDPSSSEGRREKMPIGGGDSYDVSEHSNEVVFQPELSAPKSEISHEDPSSSEGRREKMPIGGDDSYDVSEHSNEVVFQPELSVLESESNPSELQIEMNKCDGGRIACPRGTDELGTSIQSSVSGEMSRPARSRRKFLGCFPNYGNISISVKPRPGPTLGRDREMAESIAVGAFQQVIEATVKSVGATMKRQATVKSVGATMKRQFNYLCCFTSNIATLKHEAEALEHTAGDLQDQVNSARDNVQVISREVEAWLKESNHMKDLKKTILDEVPNVESGCLKLRPRFSLSKRAKKTADNMKELRDRGKFDVISRPGPSAAMEGVLLGTTYEFVSRKQIEEDIMKSLRDREMNMIGICGMGGLGKTTMAKMIMNRTLKDQLFDGVVMVVVSQPVDKLKIQLEIGAALGLKDLEKETSEASRVKKLHARLTAGSKRILLVLDDVWGKVMVEEFGIPRGCKACTILLTCRNHDVLRAMNVEKDFGMEVLTEEDAWFLFRKTIGTCVDDAGLNSIAKQVVKECRGLPIAIITLGAALKDESDKRIWKDVLRQLREASPTNIPNFIEDVYKPLKVSYDKLGSEEVKSVFLLCCLFGEDANIPIENLTYFCMGLGIFKDNLERARNRMSALIKMLKSQSLLLDGRNDEHVKMHDVVRDVCIFISKEKGYIGGNDCTWISSFETTVGERSNLPASLRLLFLSRNNDFGKEQKIIKFDHSSLEGIRDLHVLYIENYLSFTSLTHTTESLRNLGTLVLVSCLKLETLSFVGQLPHLEILICHDCPYIMELPHEIKRLNRLKLLDLTRCYGIQKIDRDIISSLVGLEELKMLDSFKKWEAWDINEERENGNARMRELEALTNLRCLEIEIENTALAAEIMCLSSKLETFEIRIPSLYVDSD